ncbi:MAG TPA: shikimate dehydrogenase [Clostridiales bacterium]|nr:shikimate dehydrogenase [Clostridiales bacterium]
MQITASTKIAALIGHPVGHSLSPVMHNHLYEKLDLDMAYLAFDVPPDQVVAAVDGLRALGCIGFNVTIPHKEAVYSLLDHIDENARVIGAVNTVKIDSGVLSGYNTDGPGFIQSLKNMGYSIKGKKTVIIGAGGSARAIGVYAAKEDPESILILNRTHEKAEVLAGLINEFKGRQLAGAVHEIPGDADIIINTTKLGMWPDINGNPLEGHKLDSRTVVCDIVYNPRQTAMLKYAQAQGCKTCGGLSMLICQGLRAVEIWLGYSLPGDSWQIMNEAANVL